MPAKVIPITRPKKAPEPERCPDCRHPLDDHGFGMCGVCHVLVLRDSRCYPRETTRKEDP